MKWYVIIICYRFTMTCCNNRAKVVTSFTTTPLSNRLPDEVTSSLFQSNNIRLSSIVLVNEWLLLVKYSTKSTTSLNVRTYCRNITFHQSFHEVSMVSDAQEAAMKWSINKDTGNAVSRPGQHPDGSAGNLHVTPGETKKAMGDISLLPATSMITATCVSLAEEKRRRQTEKIMLICRSLRCCHKAENKH